MTLRALVVDDERLARVEMTRLLAVHADIEVVGEADGAAAAAEAIARLAPDVVFLDVQMPGCDGFELLSRLSVVPRVVFVTAHDDHALRAFEVNALDFLLKPVRPERLAIAVRRLLEGPADDGQTASSSRLGLEDTLFLTTAKRARFLRVRAIAALVAAGDYVEIVSRDGESYLTSRSLQEWEARLPPQTFARLHRSTLVNLDAIRSTLSTADRDELQVSVELEGMAAPIRVSRRALARLRAERA
jgi:two-component system, LytTR family, response regulator